MPTMLDWNIVIEQSSWESGSLGTGRWSADSQLVVLSLEVITYKVLLLLWYVPVDSSEASIGSQVQIHLLRRDKDLWFLENGGIEQRLKRLWTVGLRISEQNSVITAVHRRQLLEITVDYWKIWHCWNKSRSSVQQEVPHSQIPTQVQFFSNGVYIQFQLYAIQLHLMSFKLTGHKH